MRYFDRFEAEDGDRFCYARAEVLREWSANATILDAVLKELKVPIARAKAKALTDGDKRAAIAEHITHLRKLPTSAWHKVPDGEIFAAAVFRAKLPAAARKALFAPVKREADLAPVAVRWIRNHCKCDAFEEVPMGKNRADVVGFKAGGWFSDERVFAIELKNTLEELQRGLDQLATYADYAHCVIAACTPQLAARYLDAHANGRGVHAWDPKVLNNKLERLGFGLLIIEGDEAYGVVPAKERDPAESKLNEVKASFKSARK